MHRHYARYEGGVPPANIAGTDMMQHIMGVAYSRSITDPTKLNRYKGFSEEVYGEFNAVLVSELVRRVPIRPTDLFVDLGSGVGQVVLQMSGEAMCPAYGIEKQDQPAQYARELETTFEGLMSWFGKRHADVSIEHGDFLDERYRNLMTDADVIFVNNYAFGSQLNQQLKERFANCKEGCRIVSSKAFTKPGFTITDRTMGDIGCILTVKTYTAVGEGVSWTSEPIDYYVHTVDRSMLEEFYRNPDRRPVRCSEPVPELEAAALASPLPLLSSRKDRPQQRQGKRALSAFTGNMWERAGSDPVSKRPRGAASRVSGLGQYLSAADARIRALIRDVGPVAHGVVPELQLKTQAAEEEAQALEHDVHELRQRNALLARANDARRDELLVDIEGTARGDAADQSFPRMKQTELAIDCLVDYEIFSRFRGMLQAEVAALQAQRMRLDGFATEVVPAAESLARTTKLLRIDKEWPWTAVFDQSPQAAANVHATIRNAVRPEATPTPTGAAAVPPSATASQVLRVSKEKQAGRPATGTKERSRESTAKLESSLIARWNKSYFAGIRRSSRSTSDSERSSGGKPRPPPPAVPREAHGR